VTLPRVPAAERMTSARWTALKRDWQTPRTTVATYADLVAAVGAGQRVTISDGVTLAGADLDLPAGADVRADSYLGATLNFSLRCTSVADVFIGGLRLAVGGFIFAQSSQRVRAVWNLVQSPVNTQDYGLRFVACNDSHMIGNVTRRQRVYGQSLESGDGCSIRQARWDSIGRSPPVLDGITECGINFASPGVLIGGEGFGSAWAEVRVDDRSSGSTGTGTRKMLLTGLRLAGRVGFDIVALTDAVIRNCRADASLYGLWLEPNLSGGGFASVLVTDIAAMGGVFGLNLEDASFASTVQRITAYGQTGACIRQHRGAPVIDLASSDLVPGPGGVPFVFDNT
jgi:hypothetical protein